MRPKQRSQQTKMLFLILADAELPHAFARFQMCTDSDNDYPYWGQEATQILLFKHEKKKNPDALKLQDILVAMFRLDRKASLWEHSFPLVPFHLLSSDGEDGKMTDWVEDV